MVDRANKIRRVLLSGSGAEWRGAGGFQKTRADPQRSFTITVGNNVMGNFINVVGQDLQLGF
jgi:hypothetical protein